MKRTPFKKTKHRGPHLTKETKRRTKPKRPKRIDNIIPPSDPWGESCGGAYSTDRGI